MNPTLSRLRILFCLFLIGCTGGDTTPPKESVPAPSIETKKHPPEYYQALDAERKITVLTIYNILRIESATDFSPQKYAIKSAEQLYQTLTSNGVQIPSDRKENRCYYIGYKLGEPNTPKDNAIAILVGLSDGSIFAKGSESSLNISGESHDLRCDIGGIDMNRLVEPTFTDEAEDSPWTWIRVKGPNLSDIKHNI